MSDIFTYTLTDDEHPSTCVLFRPDLSPEAVQFGARERSANEYQYDDPPDWFAPRFKGGLIFVVAGWSQTDGWRGHTEFDISPGWSIVGTGWTTGHPDETVSHKLEAAQIYEKMVEKSPPFPVAWLFGTTSNVFSQVTDVLVRDEDEPKWEAYLVSLGSDADTFTDSFR